MIYRQTVPELTPDILMVDGNGLLHPRQCGIACHIGVETSIPTLGVAKNLHQIQEFGQEFTRENVRQRFESLTDQDKYRPDRTVYPEIPIYDVNLAPQHYHLLCASQSAKLPDEHYLCLPDPLGRQF